MGNQILCGEAELPLLVSRHRHWDSPGHDHRGAVRHVGGFGNDDFVPGVNQGPEGKVNGLTPPHRNQDLILRIVLEMKAPFQIVCDLHPQFPQPRIGGVCSALFLQGVDGLIPDVPRRSKIWLAHP